MYFGESLPPRGPRYIIKTNCFKLTAGLNFPYVSRLYIHIKFNWKLAAYGCASHLVAFRMIALHSHHRPAGRARERVNKEVKIDKYVNIRGVKYLREIENDFSRVQFICVEMQRVNVNNGSVRAMIRLAFFSVYERDKSFILLSRTSVWVTLGLVNSTELRRFTCPQGNIFYFVAN